jgi:predicted nucleotidyltransferase component of viral defense system
VPKKPKRELDLAEIRRTAITALFSDDVLTEYLVLKGGNALNLVHGITSRASIDLDFAMGQDFKDFEDGRSRVFAALRNRFEIAGYSIFDEKFEVCPDLKGAHDERPWWGGYEVQFKLIERGQYRLLKDNPKKLRDYALVLGGNKRPFKIDLSKCEYTEGKAEHEMNSFPIYVYTPEMIALEKLRAICQQMPEYPYTGTRSKSGRARDFYDIYHVVTSRRIDLRTEENKTLLRHIFGAKEVPLSLLGNLSRERDFHRTDWQSVKDATTGELQGFDFYFDFVLNEVESLKLLWME